MKKIIFTGILSILFVGISFAQAPRIGVTAGLNVSNMTTKSDGQSETNDFKAGFQVGVVADFAITENFSIIPELLFSQRGAKHEVKGDANNYEKSSMTLNYLQLPINAAYKFDVGMGSKLFIFAGPYLGYGLSGKTKWEDVFEGKKETGSENVKFGSKENDVKPFDFGVNAGVGYQYEKIFFKLQYNLGLANLSNASGSSAKNTNIGVSVGYFFN